VLALHAAGDGSGGLRCVRRPPGALVVLAMLASASWLAGQARPQAVRVSQDYAVRQLLKKVNPEYPEDLKKKRVQGMVSLKIRISKEGDVKRVELVSGNPELARLAIDALKQWKYKPYLMQEQPWEVETTVQINFSLAYE
jgi:TonB family protein